MRAGPHRDFVQFMAPTELTDSMGAPYTEFTTVAFSCACKYVPKQAREFSRAGQVDETITGMLIIRGHDLPITGEHRAVLDTGQVFNCIAPINPDRRGRELLIMVTEYTPRGISGQD